MNKCINNLKEFIEQLNKERDKVIKIEDEMDYLLRRFIDEEDLCHWSNE